MNLTEPQKKYLRRLGHDLKPVIHVGDAGLTDSLLTEFERSLLHHELLKVKIRVGDRELRDSMITSLCDKYSASLVQKIGNVALLYRINFDKKRDKRIALPK